MLGEDNGTMRRLRTIMRKEFIHILRDTRTLALIALLPALLLLLTGTAVSGETGDLSMAVLDRSKTAPSRWYVDQFWASGYFKVTHVVQSEDELLELIERDAVRAGLVIPEDFGRHVSTGEPTAVLFYINDTDPAMAQQVQLGASSISQMVTQEVFVKQLSRQGMGGFTLALPIETHLKFLYNPEGSNAQYMIPALMAAILQIQSLLLTALAIVREREIGTMEQLIVTPIKAWELMLGKILPYVLVAFLNTLVIIAIGLFYFDIVITGNLIELLLLSLVFIIGSLGMGVLISNVSKSQMQAMYLATGLVLIPAILLSGMVFPRFNMPTLTYWVGWFLPITHYLEIIRGVMNKGVGIGLLWSAIWPLIVLSLGYFAASVVFFKKRID